MECALVVQAVAVASFGPFAAALAGAGRVLDGREVAVVGRVVYRGEQHAKDDRERGPHANSIAAATMRNDWDVYPDAVTRGRRQETGAYASASTPWRRYATVSTSVSCGSRAAKPSSRSAFVESIHQ